jgi:mycobactin peptide synthetase MbtF
MAQLTAEKFVRDPVMPHRRMYKTGDLAVRRPSGEHLYLGRADDQIKLNGFRVEPMEISNALLRHPDVEDAFVALRPVAAATDPNRLADLLSDLATQDAEAILARVESMSDAQIAAELADI